MDNECTCPPMHKCPRHGVKANRKERRRLQAASTKQQVRNAFLAGIKAQRMADKPWCENCGRTDGPLDLHHITKRSQGSRFDGEEYGVDRPQNLSLLCRWCHAKVESNPQWTKTA